MNTIRRMKELFNISELIKKQITGQLSPDEKIILDNWLNDSDKNKELLKKLSDVKYQETKLQAYNAFNKNGVRRNIENELFGKKLFLIPSKLMKYAAAILLPLLITGGILLVNNRNQGLSMATLDENITPGTQKATLILSDGTNVNLDQSNKEEVIKEEGILISNRNKKLNYNRKIDIASIFRHKLIFNELKTPRGGGYNLRLADGTEVWLNAGSSLRYPVEFTDSIRQVFLSGEAYFDVTHSGKPFVVSSAGMDVRVLGTRFNISAYNDEEAITTTLVDGKVAIQLNSESESTGKQTILTPGLQAVMNKTELNVAVNKVATSQYTSWIDGKLEFNNQNLAHVMKRLARWYDFEYSFENEAARNYHFSARVNADENISEILKMLELTTDVKFTIEKNTIVIN